MSLIENKRTQHEKKESYRMDIQGLRAIAVLAVIAFHAKLPISGGFTGVDVFFVISGFVITRMLTNEWMQLGRLSLTTFYWRRFKRLTPALVLVVLVTVVLSLFLLSPLGPNFRVVAFTGLSAILMSANIFVAKNTGGYFDAAADTNPLINTWSLSVEEQFYLLFPLVLVFAFKLAKVFKSSAVPVLAVGLVFVASLGAMFWGWSGILTVDGSVPPFYNALPRAWEFSAGALLALINVENIRTRKLCANLFSFGGGALLIYSFFFIKGGADFPGVNTFPAVIGAMMLIIAGENKNSIACKLLARNWFVKVGDISYSLYLWHWPFIVLTAIAISSDVVWLTTAAVISIIPAMLSSFYVENKIRAYDLAANKQRFIAVTVVAFVSISCIYFAIHANKKSYWNAEVATFKRQFETLHLGNVSGCGQGALPTEEQSCTWNKAANGKDIYAIGDSNIDHFSEALLAASTELQAPLHLFSKGGCSFLGRSWSDRTDHEQRACLSYVDGAIRYLESAKHGVVILGVSDSVWRYDGVSVGKSRLTEIKDSEVIEEYLQQDLLEKIKVIRSYGHEVILLLPVPKFISKDNKKLFDPERCSTISIIGGECPSRIAITLEDANAYQMRARKAIKYVSSETGAGIMDFRSQICPEGVCMNYLGSTPLYRDAGHLSVEGSRLFGQDFSAAIRHYGQ